MYLLFYEILIVNYLQLLIMSLFGKAKPLNVVKCLDTIIFELCTTYVKDQALWFVSKSTQAIKPKYVLD